MVFDYKKIYDIYYKKCYIFAKSYVHNDLVAKDIASESLIKFWEISQSQEIDNIGRFLFEISKNRSLDYLKHERVKNSAFEEMHTLADREMQIRISTLESSNLEKIFASDIHDIIEDTLSRLPEQTCQIFRQYRFGGIEKNKVAEEFGISLKGVDYHVLKAVKYLKIALKDYITILASLLFVFF